MGANPLAATNKGDWATNVFVGADQDVGVKTVGVADLTTDSTYYYRSYASNDAGEAWAPASAIFITGEVTVQATDSNAWETGPDNGVFTVSRPAGTTNEALTVSYTLSGTATSGADYEALPGSVVIPAGATHATVTVKPIDDLTFNETNETVILTLVSGGAYPVGPPGSAQMTIADNEVLQKGFYRMKITFSGYDRGEALLNFPVLVVFSNGMGGSDFSFTNHPFLTTSGYDLRFLDATESFNLPYEIEHWNSNGPCHVWVRAPAIAAPTDYIWATWADPAHTNQETYTTNGQVWSAGYGAVWHIAQANPIDSVSTNDGTQYDGVTLISTGRVDGADSFDGTDMRIDTPYLQNAVTAYTAEAWVKTTDSDPLRPIVQNRDGGTDDDPANSLTLGFGRTFGAARMAALRGIHGSYWTKRTS